MYIYSICIIYLLAIAELSKGNTDCPCDAAHFCHCSSMHWEAIPSGLPRDVRGLNLSSNAIQIVTETDLKPYDQLQTLLLQYNAIHTINDGSFQPLGNLEELDLSYNNLVLLSSVWFRNLNKLKHLNLLGNQYITLGNDSLFASLSSLSSLQFGNQNFDAIQKQSFEGLERLNTLEINAAQLTLYEEGSLGRMKQIYHTILRVNLTLLPALLKDLVHSVTLLEITDTEFSTPADMQAFEVLAYTSVKQFIFRNCTIVDVSGYRFVEIIQTYRNITDVVMKNCRLLGRGLDCPNLKRTTSSVTTIIINNIEVSLYYIFSDLSSLHQIIPQFTYVTVTDSPVYLIPCQFSQSFTSLQYLDVSGGKLDNTYLGSSVCYHEGGGACPKLQTLNVSRNLLTSVPKVAQFLSGLNYLTNLDISQNKFSELSTSKCQWPKNLKYLNISNNQINIITTCIPPTLQILDVSSNYLTVFAIEMPNLTELYISNNRLSKLPEGMYFTSLVLLSISRNDLNGFGQSDLELFSNRTILDARANNYKCSCQFLDFIRSNTAVLVGWPDNYKCASPASVKDVQIQDANLPPLVCHKTLIVTLSCILLIALVAAIVALCHFLHVVWYAKMTWAWLKAKRKPLKNCDREICFDGFVSYSERDSEWVENMMVPKLENATLAMKLCLHKRDFVPGKWIIDNIIDAMEKSYKTVFVLSEHFVRSEWCKYELEFSHFRLFDENNDSAILILLDPIEKETVPKRFCKLRKLMNTKTYLEWPTDEEQQEVFWDNLKTALQPADYIN
ncbi:toll-like receptor 2 type-2 [Xenopus tropicalis]|nr:toll-like receptor 2 type-2 [Xenopus tropicalis]|eukprot:XP_017946494.1 PREDICTED: toll-like receptor 2 type-2 [Xenopus tropicalis]